MMFEQFLNPKTVFNFIRSNTDYTKLAMNLINSEEAKEFVINDLGLDYESLKNNLILAFANSEKSNIGIQKQQELEQSQKIQIYRELANTLIKEDGLSVYSAIVLAAGFTGIDQNKVVEFLKSKGYTATKQRIENYYKTNEGFLKTLFKKHGKVIPGWNDSIESVDLDLEEKEDRKLVELPDTSVEEELGIDEKQ